VSPTKTAVHSPRAPVAQAPRGSRPRRSYPSREEALDREQLFERLAHLRAVVPVFADELVSARRQAASLRVANGWLLEQVRQLQRQLLESDGCRAPVEHGIRAATSYTEVGRT
jgi:hypothetical protein